MKRTLISIDLDYFFSCDEYARYIHHNLSSEDSWKSIYAIEHLFESKLEIDDRLVDNIIDILKGCNINDNVKIETFDEHDMMLTFLEECKEEKLNVINIDFHHDFSYNGDDSELNIENWVKLGFKKGIINNYVWLCRAMSEPVNFFPTVSLKTINPVFDKERAVDEMKDIDVCYIMFSISKHFTPSKYHEKILETINKILQII